VAALLPIIAVVFIAFLVIGLALPVLPLHVHQDLGLGTFVVGLVAGAQFAASLLSRFWAGNYADSRGAKRALVTGLLVAAVAGLLYLLSLRFVSEPETSVTILLLGRAVLGVAESFIVTGAFTWGLSLVGPQNTGKIMAWVGTAMYAAFAVGAPAGTTLYAGYGFAAPRRAAAPCPPCIHQGSRFRLGAGSRLGAQQRRLRCDHDVHRAALCTTWVGSGLACLYRSEHRLHGGAPDLRPPAGQDRRR
jgi:MFS family permease